MKLRKIALLFLLVGFGITIEAISAVKRAAVDADFPGFRFVKGSRFAGPSYEFTDSRTLPSLGVRAVRVVNEFGNVRVRQSSDPAESGDGIRVVVTKEVHAPSEARAKEFADKVALSTRDDAGTLQIGTNRVEVLGSYGRDAERFGFGLVVFDEGTSRTKSPDDVGVRTHIEVIVRERLDVKVENRHGRIDIDGARGLLARGEFDDVSVARIEGGCDVKNRHGNLEVVGAATGCAVSLEHGDAHLENLGGSSVVGVAHGELDVTNAGDLELNLRYCDLEARDISGALRMKGERNDLRVQRVSGDVTVENRGDVDLTEVTGRVNVTNRHGHVRILRAMGETFVKNAYENVSLLDVGGPVEVDNDRGSVRASRLARGAKIRSSGDDVEIGDFGGRLDVEVSRGGIRIAPAKPVTAPVVATTGGGDIVIAFPEGSRALVDAETERGDLDVDDPPRFETTDKGRRSVRGRLGGGGEMVKLRSRLGDIRLTAAGHLDISDPDEPSTPEIERRSSDPLPRLPRVPRVPEAPRVPPIPPAPAAPGVAPVPAVPPVPPAPTPTPGR